MSVPQATRTAQAKATNPRGSAWVSANAGSGKTFVLARRVLRLLLDDQDPSSLLCLTFTKAAAAEMAARVFDELARWTRLDDQDLADTLADLQGAASPRDLAKARSLFARALETPGGLKIQTIHAFSESLLHQFPFEANVAASFTVLDDRDADALMQAARADVIARAARGNDKPLAAAFDRLLRRMADMGLNDTLDAVLRSRHALVRAFDAVSVAGFDARLSHLLSLHAALLGLGESDPQIIGKMLADPMQSSPHLPSDYIEMLQAAVPDPSATDIKNTSLMVTAHKGGTAEVRARAWSDLLYTGTGAPRGLSRFLPRIAKQVPDVLERVTAEQQRGANLIAHAHYADLMHVALKVLDRFESLKARRGALDFDDLIARTAALLTRSDAQAWVRYKIDQRIDHVLVDEAQDTSAQQWVIIRALSDDFFDGDAARQNVTPTFFAVGDDKQSIYSFQGADPRQFDGTRRALETKALQAQIPFEARVQLLLSFRSTRDILSAVDTVFARSQALQGVTLDQGLVHEPFRDYRGQVEIWPIIKGQKTEEPEDWTAPVDTLPAPHLQLADAIAQRIAELIAGGQTPGDILILLRTRGAMADAINRALKQRAIAVAGTDRLLLTDHIAVEDLMVLMQVALLPEEDLALATLLTSPLVGLSDEQLESLAAGRPGLLIDALNAPTDDPAIHQAALDVRHWRAMADYASPFTFLSTVLGADGGRAKMMARLGEDCRDPLDEVLRLARAEETRPGSALASLEAFLDTLRRIKLDIKRDMETRADKVRIMTVHGSKGLEAHTVFLVDTCRLPMSPRGIVEVELPEGETGQGSGAQAVPPLVLIKSDTHAPAYSQIKQARETRQLEEYRRLLYVAMTRAKDQLIITGHTTSDKEIPEGSWYDLVDKALGEDTRDVGALPGLPGLTDSDPVRVWRADPWPSVPDAPPDAAAPDVVGAPQVEGLRSLITTATPAPKVRAPLRPSRAHKDAALSAENWHEQANADRHSRTAADLNTAPAERQQAMLFGTLVHKLLEMKGAPTLDDALRLAKAFMEDADDRLVASALKQAQAVRSMPQSEMIFGPTSRAEVAVRGTLTDQAGQLRPITGSIDRLVLGRDEILAIDFKTNSSVPDPENLGGQVPDYCAQMAIYADLLAAMFPEKAIRCGLLWTSLPRLDWISAPTLDEARAALGIGLAKA
ncbi:MAG: double-strand break repair helicase AddA [Hyphomicrobiales bacterium]